MTTPNIADLVVFSEHEPEFDATRTPADRCLSGQPTQRTWNHYTSPDGKFFAGVWEAEPGHWRIAYTEHELCLILAGHSVIRDASGQARHLRAGDEFVIPAGFEGSWEVLETTRKIYAIYQP